MALSPKITSLMDRVQDIVAEVAATEIMPRFGRLQEEDIKSKTGEHDLVTTADLEAERVYTRRLVALLPGSVVVGEEGVHARPALLKYLSGENPVWIVDPVDGTGNFAKGDTRFRSMVSLVQNRQVCAAWLHDPVSGITTLAERGSGARRNGQILHVTRGGEFRELTGFINQWVLRKLEQVHGPINFFADITHRACCGVQYDEMVCAKPDQYPHRLFAFYGHMKAWDHAPGSLIYQEAGGIFRLLDRTEFYPGIRGPGILAAPCESSWERLRDVFTPAFDFLCVVVILRGFTTLSLPRSRAGPFPLSWHLAGLWWGDGCRYGKFRHYEGGFFTGISRITPWHTLP